MKTKSLFKSASLTATYILVFLWTAFTVNAQCPTISDPTPPPICDASAFNFDDLNAFATDTGDGIVWYGMSVGGSPFNGTELVFEGTYYADNNSGSCSTRASIVIDFQVNLTGLNLDGIYCTNENPTIQSYINEVLQSYIPAGGSVEIYNDFELTDQPSNTDALGDGATNYYIIFIDASGCKSQILVGSTAVFDSPEDPTPNPTQQFCSIDNPTIGDLDPGTIENVSWYNNVDGSGNPIPPALNNSTVLVNGNTYYVQIEDVFCVSDPIQVIVTIDTPNDSGISATLLYCEDNLPASDINLFNELGGMPDTNGTWTGPLTTSNGHLGTVNISTVTFGNYVFTYTVPSSGACPPNNVTVTITVFEMLSSGTPSAANPVTFCENELPTAYDLFLLLDNEDPGGQWTLGATVISSPYDLSGLTDGTHNFTYTQNETPNPCIVESTPVQVIVLVDPNAGNAINATFCENDVLASPPYDLFDALDGTEDNNSGTWTDVNGIVVSNPIDITGFTVVDSPYQFTYTVSNGTCEDMETITITVEEAPESGTALSPVEICEDVLAANSPFDLFTLLDGSQDTDGTWSDVNGPVANPVDITGLTADTHDYTYSVPIIGTCSDVDVVVQIIVLPKPVTGVPIPATFCENDLADFSPLDLFEQLTGEDAGGTWTDDDASGALTGSNVDLTVLTIDAYNYSYTITDASGCTSTSIVTINIVEAPESGTALSPVEICEDVLIANSPFDLFTLLDGSQDTDGTWSDVNGPVTNPVDITGLTADTHDYTYSVPVIGTCSDVDVVVQIIVLPKPITGVPIPATFCENDLAANSPLDLFDQLTGEDAGGTWTDDDASGALTGSNVDLTVLTIDAYNYSYTITDASGCTSTSTVTITIVASPESGIANTPITFCLAEITSGQTYDLFDLLDGEDTGGTWSDDTPSSQLAGSILTLDGLTSGTYNFTYDVAAIGTCDDNLVSVSVIINDIPTPTVASPQEFCDTATIGDLAPNGTNFNWYDQENDGTLLIETTPLLDGLSYYVTQIDPATGCESFIRGEVQVTIHQSPNAGNATTISLCNDSSIDLNTGLDGTQDAGGVWQDTDGTGGLTGNMFDATGVVVGTYDFTYYVAGSAPCPDASTIIQVTINEPLNPGSDATLDICSDNGTTDLFTLIGAADTGGTWSPTLTSGTGIFDPTVDATDTYTYTLTNDCGTYTSDVVVTVTQTANAGTNGLFTICVFDVDTTNNLVDLLTVLNGTPDATGTFSNDDMANGFSGTILNLDLIMPGTYNFTYNVVATAPCLTNATAIATVTLNNVNAPVVIVANPEFCASNNPTVIELDAFVTGGGNYTWYLDKDLTMPVNPSDPLIDGQTYYATDTDTTIGCESSEGAELDVIINDTDTPTEIIPNNDYCINDDPTIQDLTLNILEYNPAIDNVIWYDDEMNGNVIDASTVLTLGTTYYGVLFDEITGCESSVRLEVTPDLTSCGELVIPDGFSPNGDGINDTFDADNLDVLYPNFKMEIYNRYGNMVYKGNASSPRFDGTSNQSGTLGKGDLPVGVYFYTLHLNDGVNKPRQGRLYLNR